MASRRQNGGSRSLEELLPCSTTLQGLPNNELGADEGGCNREGSRCGTRRKGNPEERAMTRILIGGVVAGIVIFFWGFVAHMLLPLGELGLRSIPKEDELTAAIKKEVREPGLYLVPGRDMSKSQTQEEMEAYTAKITKGPYGFMVIYPDGRDVSMSKRLPIEFGRTSSARFWLRFSSRSFARASVCAWHR